MDRWTNIRLLKRGCASEVYCLKFSEVRANFMQLKPKVDNFDNCDNFANLKTEDFFVGRCYSNTYRM